VEKLSVETCEEPHGHMFGVHCVPNARHADVATDTVPPWLTDIGEISATSFTSSIMNNKAVNLGQHVVNEYLVSRRGVSSSRSRSSRMNT
jgi:hypothetical protein